MCRQANCGNFEVAGPGLSEGLALDRGIELLNGRHSTGFLTGITRKILKLRISLIRSNLINRSARLLNFCMVRLELSLFCISIQTGKSAEAFDPQMALIA